MKDKEKLDQEMNQNDTPVTEEITEVNLEELVKDAEDADNVTPAENSLEEEILELKNKYLRLYSDFENYRKRTSKERLDLITNASEDVLKDLIPVVDDFERSLKASESETDSTKVREGNLLIFQKLVRILTSKGLMPMEDLVGKSFDADTQEAITQIPAPSEKLKGKVVDVVEKGYKLGDKVVRFAKVVTGA
ncbi:MAG: molecular chaperone GrpE [Algoriphagus sp.]|jgi:molecular chaperone GrpE